MSRRHLQKAPRPPVARYRLLYLVNGQERKSPWFIRYATARRAELLIQAKYPGCSSSVYLD